MSTTYQGNSKKRPRNEQLSQDGDEDDFNYHNNPTNQNTNLNPSQSSSSSSLGNPFPLDDENLLDSLSLPDDWDKDIMGGSNLFTSTNENRMDVGFANQQSSNSSLSSSSLAMSSSSSFGTITSQNELVMPHGERKKFNCKKCKNELHLMICPTSKCPLKIHKHQNIKQDADYLKENCHIKGDECFCKKLNDDNYFDVIGRCMECRNDYHVCPVGGCSDIVNLSTTIKEKSKSRIIQFNEHLKTHNGLELRRRKKEDKEINPIFNVNDSPNSRIKSKNSSLSEGSSSSSSSFTIERSQVITNPTFNLNKNRTINSIPVSSSPRENILAPGKAYLLACGEEVFPALKLIIEAEIQFESANLQTEPSVISQILLIEKRILEKDVNKNDVVAEMSRLKRNIKKKYSSIDVASELEEIEESYDEKNDKMGAIRCLERIRIKIEEVDQPRMATLALEVDDSNISSPLSLSSNQPQLIETTRADGISKDVQKGSLVFFLFYDIERLYNLMTKPRESFIQDTVPVRFVDEYRKEYVKDLNVFDIQIVIPLCRQMEKYLISKKSISCELSKWDENIQARWYYPLEKQWNCKSCKCPLILSECSISSCPLHRHMKNDNKNIGENCYSDCYCLKLKGYYEDMIGICSNDGCGKSYHTCPILGCDKLLLIENEDDIQGQRMMQKLDCHLRMHSGEILKPDLKYLSLNSLTQSDSLFNQKTESIKDILGDIAPYSSVLILSQSSFNNLSVILDDLYESISVTKQEIDTNTSTESNEPTHIMVMQLSVDISKIPLIPAIEQEKMKESILSLHVISNIDRNMIEFAVYYDLERLNKGIMYEGQDFLPNEVPVQFVKNGRSIMRNLEVRSKTLMITLNNEMEMMLASKGHISETQSKMDKKANLKLFYLNEEGNENDESEYEDESDDEMLQTKMVLRNRDPVPPKIKSIDPNSSYEFKLNPNGVINPKFVEEVSPNEILSKPGPVLLTSASKMTYAVARVYEAMDQVQHLHYYVTLMLTVANSKNFKQLASNQHRFVRDCFAEGLSPAIQVGSIKFCLFYDISKLHDKLQKDDERFLPPKISVNYIDKSGRVIANQLKILDMQLMIPLDNKLEENLMKERIISKQDSKTNGKPGLKWYWIKDKPNTKRLPKELEKQRKFYEQLNVNYPDGYVKNLCAKKFRGKAINWYLIHKYANEVGYTPSSPAESSTQNKFLQVIEKYLTHFKVGKDYKEKARKFVGEIRDGYDGSVLPMFGYDHDDQNDGYQGANEIDESHDNKTSHDDFFASKIQYHLKMIMKERKTGKSTKDGIFNGVSRIKDIIANEAEKVNSLPDNHNVLFFGRNGSGKSTLTNLLLFATTNQIPNDSYKQESASKRFHNLEAIKFLKSLDKENEIDETIFDLTEKWELIYNKNKENINAAAEVGSPIDKNCKYELVDFTNLITSDGKWANEIEYAKESETLKQHHTRSGHNAPLPVDPYILLAAESKTGVKKSNTAHINYVRYGCRWQAVLTLFTLDDILRRFDDGDDQFEMKIELWDLINALSNQNSTAESSSSSMGANIEPPSSKEEAMDFIPADFKEFMERTRGFVVIPPGDDIVIDRMIVRKEMINLVDKYGSFIKDITVFAPSTLLRDNNITLIDAPGDDDRDWAKTNQLAHACDIADSVVVLSKKEVDAGLNLDSFMALFYQRVIDSNSAIPIYVLLREDPEGFASVNDLNGLEKDRRSKEKMKTLSTLRSAVDKCSRTGGRTDDEIKALTSMKDSVDIEGGYFFYIWLAMTGLGPSVTSLELKNKLLEESGYNDFMRFLSTRVAPKSSPVISAPKYTDDILEASKDMKLLIEKDPNVEAWGFIQNKVKDSNDKRLYYSMKRTLSQHPFFWKSILNQPQDKSQGKTCSFYGEIEKICNKSAARIFKEIRSRFEGSNKADIVRKIKENWTEENIKIMLALDQPNVSHPQEYRLFAEEIIPLLAPQDYRDIIPLFDQEILPQFKKCAEDACKLHAFQDSIENYKKLEPILLSKSAISGSVMLKSDEEVVEELAKNDPLLKNAYEYVTKRLETGIFQILVRRSVGDYLKKEHRGFLERNGFLVDVRFAIKKHLLDKLKAKTKTKIDPKEIVECIVDTLDEGNLKKIILEAVEGSIHNVLRSLMHEFVEMKRLPILKRVFDTLFTSPPPSMLPETKAVIVEHLDAIISICNEEKIRNLEQ